MLYRRKKPLRRYWDYTRMAASAKGMKNIERHRKVHAHRLAALVEDVVDSLAHVASRCQESTRNETPEVEDTTNDVGVPTLIDAFCRAIPAVACWLPGFIKLGI